jgi:hypothetical protein
MDFSADSSSKFSINIQTGPLFSGNNTNFGGGGRPQRKGLFQIGVRIPNGTGGRQF